MKRVLYHYGSAHYDTGSPRALVSMIGLLDRSRWEPLFLGPDQGPLADELRRRNVTIISGQRAAPLSYRSPRATARSILKQIRLLKEHRIDLVHVNEFGWNQDLVIAGRLAAIPVILHIHNAEEICWKNLHWLAATCVLMPSAAHESAVRGFHRIARKTRVLHNSVDFQRIGHGRRIRDQLDLPETSVVVLTIAQVCYRKGIDVVIEVAERTRGVHPDTVFLIAGPDGVGEKEYAERMRQLVSQKGLEGRVRFLGSRDDIPDLLASSDLFLLPTRAEPFGIVVLEAMAAGVPVVASAVGGIPEIVHSPQVGSLVEEINPRAFAGAVGVFLENADLRLHVGRAGREAAEQRFGAARLSALLDDIYESSTAAGPRFLSMRRPDSLPPPACAKT
jgi:glycosyltransferase involved in cell wall biosynthesis